MVSVSTFAQVQLFNAQLLPYDIYLGESAEFDDRIDNLANFYHWCVSRVFSLDRTYAKEIWNILGVTQSVTDRNRALISLSFHCVSLNDVYWVRTADESVTFAELNLYDNPLNEAIVPLPSEGQASGCHQ